MRLSAVARFGTPVLALFASACGGGGGRKALAPSDADGVRSRPSAVSESPLVTEWSASEKTNLEVRLRAGGVVVEYTGRSLRLLPQCRLAGSYVFRRSTTSTDVRDIRDEGELAAKLPLGFTSLQGELQRSGRLAMQTTVSGQYQLEGVALADVPNTPECAAATHLVGALSVGAFKLRSGSRLRAGGGATVGGVGARGATDSEESVLRESGDPEKCKLSTEQAPEPECASPLQVFLQPLPRFEKMRGEPGSVRASFVSAEAERVWEVRHGGGEVCRTPCTKWVDPNVPLSMRTYIREARLYQSVDVPELGARTEDTVRVKAHTLSIGRLGVGASAGLIGTMAFSLGGMLALARCDGRHKGTCTGSLITMGVSAPIIAGGVWFALGSVPHAEVLDDPSGQVASRPPSPRPAGEGAWAVPRGLRLGGSF